MDDLVPTPKEASTEREEWKLAGVVFFGLVALVLLYETMGEEWMNADMFRFGASSLLNDVLMQLKKEKTGAYQSGDYFTLD